MNGFERDVLTQLVKKIESKEEEARLSNQAWRRFVWTDEDIQILRSAGEAPGVMDVTTDMPLPEQQRALMEHIDEVLREAGY
jgi:hypothetical protein